jgi:hypothetical protein
MPVKLIGWPEGITAYEWIVTKATHKLGGGGGYLTSLELENKSAASDHVTVDDSDALLFATNSLLSLNHSAAPR